MTDPTDVTTADDTPDESMSYVDAMAELEGILTELERPDIDIDVLADQVERASFLVTLCRSRIERARGRITEIVADLESDG